MKHIDANKLKKSINNYMEGAYAALNPIDGDADYYKGKIDACKDIQEFIASLQHDQPKFNIPSAGSGAMGTTPPKFKLDVKEQSVKGLEEEIKRMVYDVVYDLDGPAIMGTSEYLSVEDIASIARHFYEQGLNARKEDK